MRITRRFIVLALSLLLIAPAARAQFRNLHEQQSPFSKVTVRENQDGLRQLIFDDSGAVQSAVNINHPDDLILSYSKHIMAALPVVDKPRRVLIVGLGGGSMPRFIHRLLPDVQIDNVEIDPVVADVAKRFFFFREDDKVKLHIGDGRKFIEQSHDKYDIIFLDAFGADWIPYMLATQEFLTTTKAHLAEGGIVAANVWYDEPTYPSMVKTYASVFPELHLVRCATSGNMIVVACAARAGLDDHKWIERATAFEKAHPTGLDLPRLIEAGYSRVSIKPDARILLDKDAPKTHQ